MPDALPLQSHNHIVNKWYPPPGSRFVSYGYRDEEWMKPLGLGTVKRELADLYDVRDSDGKLVGWANMSPVFYGYDLHFLVSPNLNYLVYCPGSAIEREKYEVIQIRTSDWNNRHQFFKCWTVDSEADIKKLIDGKWMLPKNAIREYPIDINARRYSYTVYPDAPFAGVI